MSIERQFSSSVAWMAVGNWTEQALNFIVFILLARWLGAESFGLLAMAATLVLLAEFLVRESLSEFLIAHPDPAPGHYNAAFWLLGGLGVILFVALLLLAGPVAALYGEPQVAPLMRALAPVVLSIAFSAVPVAILRRELNFRIMGLRAILGVVAGGIVSIAMALTGFGVWALIGQRLALILANDILAWAVVRWRPARAASLAQMREIMRLGGPVLSLRAAEFAVTQVPTVVIGAALGPVALGLFSIAWRLVEIASFLLSTPLRMVAQPAFAAVSRGGGAAAGLLVDIGRMSGLVAFPAVAGMAVLAAPLLHLLFGAEWVPAAPLLAVMSALVAYLCIEKVHQAFFLAGGRAGTISLIAWAETALCAALVAVTARFGATAMTAAYVGAFLLLWPLRFVVLARFSGQDALRLAAIHLPPVLCAAAMAAVVAATIRLAEASGPLVQVAAGMLAGLLSIGALTLLFMRDRLALFLRFVRASREHPEAATAAAAAAAQMPPEA